MGQGKYAFITSQEGGIINDPVLLRLGENHFWLSLADTDVLLWAKGVAHDSGFDVQITEPDVGPMQIQGPKSKEVMTDLFGQDILALGYYHLVRRELDGMDLVISRTGYSGELGYELYLMNASRDGLKLWDTVLEAGKPHGLSPIGPCHIRRIEGGILAHGCDMTITENPYEVGYGYKWMVELDQDQDFIGREALREISHQGVRRRLVGVEIGGEQARRLQRRFDAGLLPGPPGQRREGRQGHLGVLLASPGQEHRLRHGSRRVRRARNRAGRRAPR